MAGGGGDCHIWVTTQRGNILLSRGRNFTVNINHFLVLISVCHFLLQLHHMPDKLIILCSEVIVTIVK